MMGESEKPGSDRSLEKLTMEEKLTLWRNKYNKQKANLGAKENGIRSFHEKKGNAPRAPLAPHNVNEQVVCSSIASRGQKEEKRKLGAVANPHQARLSANSRASKKTPVILENKSTQTISAKVTAFEIGTQTVEQIEEKATQDGIVQTEMLNVLVDQSIQVEEGLMFGLKVNTEIEALQRERQELSDALENERIESAAKVGAIEAVHVQQMESQQSLLDEACEKICVQQAKIAQLEKVIAMMDDKRESCSSAQQTVVSFTPPLQDQVDTLKFAYEVLLQTNDQKERECARLRVELKSNSQEVTFLQETFSVLEKLVLESKERIKELEGELEQARSKAVGTAR